MARAPNVRACRDACLTRSPHPRGRGEQTQRVLTKRIRTQNMQTRVIATSARRAFARARFRLRGGARNNTCVHQRIAAQLRDLVARAPTFVIAGSFNYG